MPSFRDLPEEKPEQFDKLVAVRRVAQERERRRQRWRPPPPGTLAGGAGARDVRPHRRRLRPHELGHDRRAAPPLARARGGPGAASGPATRALDVATGTGDLAIELARARRRRWSGSDFSERMLELARARKAPATSTLVESGATRSTLPYAGRRVRRRDGRLRRPQLLRPRPRAGARWRASCGPGGRVVVLEITTPQKPPLSWFFRLWFDRVVPALGQARRRPGRLRLPAQLACKRFPGPARSWPRGWPRAGLRDVRWILTAGGIIAIHAGHGAGEHAPQAARRRGRGRRGAACRALIERLEERLAELADGARRGAGRGTRRGDDRGRRQAPAAAARLPAAATGDARRRGVVRGRGARWSWSTRRRSSTTTCSTRAPLRRGRPTVVADGRPRWPPPPPATCCSRARSPSWRANGRAGRGPRALGRARGARARRAACSARTPGTPTSRRERYLAALRPQDRAAVRRPRAGSGALGGRPGLADALGGSAAASAWRSSCSTTCSTSPGPPERTGKHARHRPARRHGHAAADPRARARPGAGAARPARGRDAGAGGGGLRRDRGDGRARRGARARRSSRSREAKAALPGWTCRAQRAALELVADGVVDRYA